MQSWKDTADLSTCLYWHLSIVSLTQIPSWCCQVVTYITAVCFLKHAHRELVMLFIKRFIQSYSLSKTNLNFGLSLNAVKRCSNIFQVMLGNLIITLHNPTALVREGSAIRTLFQQLPTALI